MVGLRALNAFEPSSEVDFSSCRSGKLVPFTNASYQKKVYRLVANTCNFSIITHIIFESNLYYEYNSLQEFSHLLNSDYRDARFKKIPQDACKIYARDGLKFNSAWIVSRFKILEIHSALKNFQVPAGVLRNFSKNCPRRLFLYPIWWECITENKILVVEIGVY